MAMLGEIEKAREIMEVGAEKAGGECVTQSAFWSPAYLMMINYSSELTRDQVSALHLDWGKWHREVLIRRTM
jgi:hypothetical protein